MTTYRMIARPKSSVVTMDFDYYNEAMEFYKNSLALNPTKPYQRIGPKWYVSMPRGFHKATYVKVEEWHKPYPSYDQWKGVEALYHLPVPLPVPKAIVVRDMAEA